MTSLRNYRPIISQAFCHHCKHHTLDDRPLLCSCPIAFATELSCSFRANLSYRLLYSLRYICATLAGDTSSSDLTNLSICAAAFCVLAGYFSNKRTRAIDQTEASVSELPFIKIIKASILTILESVT
jgi:hypothetical protein